MSDTPDAPLRFFGVTAYQLGGEQDIGAIVSIEYAGTTHQAKVVSRNVDYDDFGTEVITYTLEVSAG